MPERQGLTIDERIKAMKAAGRAIIEQLDVPDEIGISFCSCGAQWLDSESQDVVNRHVSHTHVTKRFVAPESPGSDGRVVLEAEFCGGMITPVLDEGMDGTERLYSEWNVSVGAKPSPEASAALQAAYEIHGPVRVIIDPREQGDK